MLGKMLRGGHGLSEDHCGDETGVVYVPYVPLHVIMLTGEVQYPLLGYPQGLAYEVEQMTMGGFMTQGLSSEADQKKRGCGGVHWVLNSVHW